MRTFTYTKITGHYYCQYSDEWEEDGVDFDYDVDDDRLMEAVVHILFRDYFSETDVEYLKDFILDNDLLDKLVDNYYEEIKEYFREEAFENYK